MLYPISNFFCGLFDTELDTKQTSPTRQRKVTEYEIELFEKDGGTSFVDDRRYEVKKGMLLCVKPGKKRHSIFPLRCRYIRIYVNSDEAKSVGKVLDTLPECVYIEDESDAAELAEVLAKLGSLVSVYNETLPNKSIMVINSLLYRALHLVGVFSASKANEHITTSSKIVTMTKKYINQNFTTDCSLDAIGDAIGMSPNHVRTVFKQITGISPYEYTISKRIKEAKILIADGTLSMLEIAMRVGFCSQSHFNKIFKEQTNTTPREYRNLLLSYYKES